MIPIRLLPLAAALAACAPSADRAEEANWGDPADPGNLVPAAPSDPPAPAVPSWPPAPADPDRAREPAPEARYRCDDGGIVLARYREGGQSGLTLVIDGRAIDFHSWPAGGGYATEDGLRPGHGLYWRSGDGEARLYENALDDGFRPGDERLIARCRREG